MKKFALTIAIVLGLSFGTYAQNGGLFGYGGVDEKEEDYANTTWNPLHHGNEGEDNGLFGMLQKTSTTPAVPDHGSTDDEDAPLGSGALLLIGFGAAYAMKKRSKK